MNTMNKLNERSLTCPPQTEAWLRKHFITMKNMNAMNMNGMNINYMENHLLALLCLISSACPKVLMAHACENCKKC